MLDARRDDCAALRAEFSQVGHAFDGDDVYSPLVVSSNDGWEASRARACRQWAQLALQSAGAGDTLPTSYGRMRDALGVAGAVWRQATRRAATPRAPVGVVGVEETKGVGAVRQPVPHAETGATLPVGVGVEEAKGVEGGSSDAEDSVTTPWSGRHASVPLVMDWGTHVPLVTVAAVRDMATEHCGLSCDTDIHQPLLLLHHKGCVVYGGALAGPSRDVMRGEHDDDDDVTSAHPGLSQLVVLDPQWLATMLSRVVTQHATHRDDTATPRPRGQVPLRDVALAWHRYPDELRDSVLELLFALEMAFPGMAADGGVSDIITIPALLPDVPSNAKEMVAAVGSNCKTIKE